MKKLIFVAALLIGMAACSTGKVESVNENSVDSAVVDTVMVDTIAVDSVL